MRSIDCPIASFQVRERKNGWALHIEGSEAFFVKDAPLGEMKLVRIFVAQPRTNVQFVIATTIEVKPSNVLMVGLDMGLNNLVALSISEVVKGRERREVEPL